MLFPSHFSYCIGIITTIIPKDWLCEPCQSKHVPTSPCKVNQDIGSWASKKHRAVKTAKVKFRHLDEVIRLSSQKASAVSKNVTFSLAPKSNPQTSPPKVLGKLPRNDEVHKKPMTNQHVSCSLAKSENFSSSLLPSLFFFSLQKERKFLLTLRIHVLKSANFKWMLNLMQLKCCALVLAPVK